MPDNKPLPNIPSPELLAQLRDQEGFRASPYLDTQGVVTIGYGTNLEAHPGYLNLPDVEGMVRRGLCGRLLLNELTGYTWSRERAEAAMLDEVVQCREALYVRCPQFVRLVEAAELPRAEVLLNMAYNMGVSGLLKFKNTLALIDGALDGHNSWAAVESGLKSSLWWRQTGRRARALGRQMRTGVYA